MPFLRSIIMARKKKTQREINQGQKEIKRPIGKDANGEAIRQSFYGKTKGEAEEKWKAFLVALELGEEQLPEPKPKAEARKAAVIYPEDILFETWAWKWYEIYVEGRTDIGDDTKNNTYRPSIKNHLIPYFGKMEVRDIKDAHITLFFQSISGMSESTVNKCNFILRGIMKKAVKNGIIETDPCDEIKRPEGVEAEEKQAYTPEQERIHLDFCKTHKYGLIAVMPLKTSCSRSEAAALTVESFNTRDQIAHLNGGIQRNGEKGKGKTQYRPRKNPYDDEMAEFLQLFGLPESGFIFRLEDGRSVGQQGIRYRYEKFLEDLLAAHPEMPRLTLHELRHTYSTRLAENGASKEVVARLMGHSVDSKVTDLYIHYSMDFLTKVIRPEGKKKSIAIKGRLPSRVRL
jgi:integrase